MLTPFSQALTGAEIAKLVTSASTIRISPYRACVQIDGTMHHGWLLLLACPVSAVNSTSKIRMAAAPLEGLGFFRPRRRAAPEHRASRGPPIALQSSKHTITHFCGSIHCDYFAHGRRCHLFHGPPTDSIVKRFQVLSNRPNRVLKFRRRSTLPQQRSQGRPTDSRLSHGSLKPMLESCQDWCDCEHERKPYSNDHRHPKRGCKV